MRSVGAGEERVESRDLKTVEFLVLLMQGRVKYGLDELVIASDDD